MSRIFESGQLGNPGAFEMPEELFYWTATWPREKLINSISVIFQEGTPIALEGIEYPLVDLIAYVNRRVGAFGIGRYAALEHLEQGEKVLEMRDVELNNVYTKHGLTPIRPLADGSMGLPRRGGCHALAGVTRV